jgi:hypothetical protein
MYSYRSSNRRMDPLVVMGIELGLWLAGTVPLHDATRVHVVLGGMFEDEAAGEFETWMGIGVRFSKRAPVV